MYAGAQIPHITMSDLIYFCVSTFWRAAAHVWNLENGSIHIAMGSYEEPFRLFLLDKGPFPQHTTMMIRVSSLKDHLLKFAHYPVSERRDTFRVHIFEIPGIVFHLATDKKMPNENYRFCSAISPQQYIGVNYEMDMAAIHNSVGTVIGNLTRPKRIETH